MKVIIAKLAGCLQGHDELVLSYLREIRLLRYRITMAEWLRRVSEKDSLQPLVTRHRSVRASVGLNPYRFSDYVELNLK